MDQAGRPRRWFEPMPVPQPTPVQARNHVSGPWVAALFVIALVASALGRASTYMALVAGGQVAPPIVVGVG